MQIIPHIQIYKFLRRLKDDHLVLKSWDNGKVDWTRKVDFFFLAHKVLSAYSLADWVESNKYYMYKYLLEKWLVSEDGNISTEWEIFLIHYSSWLKRIDLIIKDYPMLIAILAPSILSIIAIIISVFALQR